MTISSFRGDNRFLSNFYPCYISYEGVCYPTMEHAFQAAKTTDSRLRLWVAAAPKPGLAKVRGRSLELREGWDDLRFGVMHTLISIKFAIGTSLSKQLLATGEEELIEGNTWHDNLWGDCSCGILVECFSDGSNYLGRQLMSHRDWLKSYYEDCK